MVYIEAKVKHKSCRSSCNFYINSPAPTALTCLHVTRISVHAHALRMYVYPHACVLQACVKLRLQSPLTSHGMWLINERVYEVVCPA